jgi:hypothetical protein
MINSKKSGIVIINIFPYSSIKKYSNLFKYRINYNIF